MCACQPRATPSNMQARGNAVAFNSAIAAQLGLNPPKPIQTENSAAQTEQCVAEILRGQAFQVRSWPFVGGAAMSSDWRCAKLRICSFGAAAESAVRVHPAIQV